MTEHRAFAVFTVSIAIAVLLCVGFTWWQVRSASRDWCGLLTDLTSVPVPQPADPAANPDREQDYRFYTELARLRTEFGCAG